MEHLHIGKYAIPHSFLEQARHVHCVQAQADRPFEVTLTTNWNQDREAFTLIQKELMKLITGLHEIKARSQQIDASNRSFTLSMEYLY